MAKIHFVASQIALEVMETYGSIVDRLIPQGTSDLFGTNEFIQLTGKDLNKVFVNISNVTHISH